MKPEMRKGTGCPAPYANVILGERFGQWPWSIESEPTDRVLYYRNILSIEGDARGLLDGLPDDEELIEVGDDD